MGLIRRLSPAPVLIVMAKLQEVAKYTWCLMKMYWTYMLCFRLHVQIQIFRCADSVIHICSGKWFLWIGSLWSTLVNFLIFITTWQTLAEKPALRFQCGSFVSNYMRLLAQAIYYRFSRHHFMCQLPMVSRYGSPCYGNTVYM